MLPAAAAGATDAAEDEVDGARCLLLAIRGASATGATGGEAARFERLTSAFPLPVALRFLAGVDTCAAAPADPACSEMRRTERSAGGVVGLDACATSGGGSTETVPSMVEEVDAPGAESCDGKMSLSGVTVRYCGAARPAQRQPADESARTPTPRPTAELSCG